ncbi:MAG: hypothetical protein WKF78_00140 [Candidatus Limnocylindrales bacterium]
MEITGPELPVVDELGAWRESLVECRDDGQLLVVDDDLADGGLGDRMVRGRDSGDRLTGEADPVDREYRPVLDRVTVVRVDVHQVRGCQDRDDAGDRLGRRRVDREDPGMRVRASEHLAVEHPRNHDVADEFGLAAQLLGGIRACHRPADLRRAA